MHVKLAESLAKRLAAQAVSTSEPEKLFSLFLTQASHTLLQAFSLVSCLTGTLYFLHSAQKPPEKFKINRHIKMTNKVLVCLQYPWSFCTFLHDLFWQ